MAEWSDLPRDLLARIAAHLHYPTDLLRFRSVCSAWRATVPRHHHHHHHHILPNTGFSTLSPAFSLSKRSIFLLFSSPKSNFSHSNSKPWLIKTEETRPGTFHLLHPLSRTHIKPLRSTFPNVIDLWDVGIVELGHEFVLQFVENGHLRSGYGNLYREKVGFLPLLGDDFVLLTIHVSGKLALFSSVDKEWNIIHDLRSPYEDVICFNGEFYAVDSTGRTVVVCVESGNVVPVVEESILDGDKKCLVQMGEDLILVDMYHGLPRDEYEGDETEVEGQGDVDFDRYIMERTYWFRVFKLDKNLGMWVNVDSLDDHVLFLGDNCAFSASASDLKWYEGNCICFEFMDDWFPWVREEGYEAKCQDIKVFDLRTRRVEPLDDYPGHSKLFWPPPPWIASAS